MFTLNADSQQQLNGILQRLGQSHQLLEQVGAVLRRAFQKMFETQGNGRWMPLKPATVAAKAFGVNPQNLTTIRHHAQARRQAAMLPMGGVGALVRSGNLRDSFTHLSAKGHVHQVTADSVTEGSQYVTEDGIALAAIQAHGHLGGRIITPRQQARLAMRMTQAGETYLEALQPSVARCLRFVGSQGEMMFRKQVRQGALPARDPTDLPEEWMEGVTGAALDWIFTGKISQESLR